MPKINRRRNKAVTIRMNDTEYAELQRKVSESGLTQQAYIINAIRGGTMATADEIAVLKGISKSFADFQRQIRGLSTNVNQMAHIANAQGVLPAESDLRELSDQLMDYRREGEEIWLSIRSSINQPKATAP